MLSVYTRHHPDCKNARDKAWRRCSCPKWIWGSLNGKFIRQSARTHRWEEAEEFRRQFIEGLPPAPAREAKPATAASADGQDSRDPSAEALPPTTKKPRVTIKTAVNAYLADAVSRNVAEATLDKLATIFRKQFLAWTQVQGFEFIDEIDLDALLNFRNTWSDKALANWTIAIPTSWLTCNGLEGATCFADIPSQTHFGGPSHETSLVYSDCAAVTARLGG